MLNKIKIELIKIFLNKIFLILVPVYALAFFGSSFIIFEMTKNLSQGGPEGLPVLINLYENTFPDIWQSLAFWGKWFSFLPAVLVIMFTSNEYNYKTLRQSIINSNDIKDFIISSFVLVLIFSVLNILIYSLICLYHGWQDGIINPFSEEFFNFTFRLFLHSIGVFSFAWMLVNILRSMAFSIIVLGIYFSITESIFSFILEKLGLYFLNKDLSIITHYMPQTSLTALIENPITAFNQGFSYFPDYPEIQSVLWIIIFYGFTYLLLKRRDL